MRRLKAPFEVDTTSEASSAAKRGESKITDCDSRHGTALKTAIASAIELEAQQCFFFGRKDKTFTLRIFLKGKKGFFQ